MSNAKMKYTERTIDAGLPVRGLRILVEEIPGARSASCGFFVATGSRDETPDIEGVSHFLEHMSFKATKKRSAIDVSLALDRMGSHANAYTSWERTVYYAQVLPEFVSDTINLISEMIDPGFLADDFETEKKVIIEEIEMYNDRPEFLLFEQLMQKRYQGHALAGRILGTRESITALPLEKMKSYHAERYHRSNVILAVAGAVKADDIFRIAGALPEGNSEVESGSGAAGAPVCSRGTGHVTVTRPADKCEHYLAAWPGPRTSDLRGRYVASVLGILLGDEEGSRLAWALTHPGITESVDAGGISFRDDGLLYAGFSSTKENFTKAREILHSEVDRLRTEGVDVDELERARTKFAARTVLGSESTMGRMSGLGNDALDGVEYHSVERELEIILSLTNAEVRTMIDTLGDPAVSAAIGPIEAQ